MIRLLKNNHNYRSLATYSRIILGYICLVSLPSGSFKVELSQHRAWLQYSSEQQSSGSESCSLPRGGVLCFGRTNTQTSTDSSGEPLYHEHNMSSGLLCLGNDNQERYEWNRESECFCCNNKRVLWLFFKNLAAFFRGFNKRSCCLQWSWNFLPVRFYFIISSEW